MTEAFEQKADFHGMYAWIDDIKLLKDNEIADYLSKSDEFDEFKDRCFRLNGSWTAAFWKGDKFFAATDAHATRSLYYRPINGRIEISENGFDLIGKNERFDIREKDQLFFVQNGFLLGDKTLHPEIKRLPAGKALCYTKGMLTIEDYKKESTSILYSSLSYTESIRQFKSLLENIFTRAKELIGDRWVVLPLTAGRDSRLIASLLKKTGFEKVHCITYGKGADTFENIKAQQIAKVLGFEHSFISSIPANCRYDGYTNDQEAIRYIKYICGLGSSYYFAEYLPAKWIQDTFKDEKPVVIPGHNGDEIRGESLVHPFLLKKDRSHLIDFLSMRDGGNCRINKDQLRYLRRVIKDAIDYKGNFNVIQLYELYINNEVMPKFYTNSARSWRYFDIPVFLPLLDKELCEFAFWIPSKYRWGRRLYEEATNEYFNEYGISFPDDPDTALLIKSPRFKIKEAIRPIIAPLWNKRSKLWVGDTIGFHELMGGRLFDDVDKKSNFKPTTENGLAAAWMLLKIEEEYGTGNIDG